MLRTSLEYKIMQKKYARLSVCYIFKEYTSCEIKYQMLSIL